MPGGEVRLVDLVKRFDDVVAVDHIDLDIRGGEFFSLLGPSGCGKTTTLRLIAGFERPTDGSILLDGVDMAQTPPHKRNVNTVFQNYALFPHLNVFDNVAFGLTYRNVPKASVRPVVLEALERVQMTGMEQRRPSQLSGGQQQRVALARALVLDPEVLLLDEPLGALDAKLRKALQVELKALQETVGITFIYVTHDQEEALTMSDRLAVMRHGRIQQIGAPAEVYQEPRTAWVADFLGVSNLMDAVAMGRSGGTCRVRVGDFELRAGSGDLDATGHREARGASRAGHPRPARRHRREPGAGHGRAHGVRGAGDPAHRPSRGGGPDPGDGREPRQRGRVAAGDPGERVPAAGCHPGAALGRDRPADAGRVG